MKKQFDLAISFAGEQREIAENIANVLSASGYSIFYDEFYKARLWGSELSVSLGEVYGSLSRYCLMIISKDYVEKMWTNHERKFAIQQMIGASADYILPLRVDYTQVPGLPSTISYLHIREQNGKLMNDIDEVCDMIIEKIGNPQFDLALNISAKDVTIIKDIINACYTRAIFTKMRGEIELNLMYKSIQDSISAIEKLVPEIESQHVQGIAIKLISNLDNLERYKNTIPVKSKWAMSWDLDETTQEAMDKLKLEAIKNLNKLRREGQVKVRFMLIPYKGLFFSIGDADLSERDWDI